MTSTAARTPGPSTPTKTARGLPARPCPVPTRPAVLTLLEIQEFRHAVTQKHWNRRCMRDQNPEFPKGRPGQGARSGGGGQNGGMELVQVAQRVTDLDRAVAFYEELLGKKVAAKFDPPGLAFFLLDGTRLLLDRVAPSSLIYLAVDDVEFSVESLRKRGVAITTEPHVIFQHSDDRLGPAGKDEWMAFITDSEGNTVGLVSYSDSDPNDQPNN
jgi:methylmalonyl-CoA/ethylmalonyl-CoA epimerase